MANTLAGFGFRPVAQYGGSPPNYALNYRQIAYDNAHTIAYGDPVLGLSTGYIDLFTKTSTTIHGIFVGVTYANPTAIGGYTRSPQWVPLTLSSTTVVTAAVLNDPTAVFMAQVNGTALTVDNVGNNIDITSASSGVPNAAGFSTCTLLSSTVNTTATLPFRILGIVPAPGPIPNYDPTADNNFVYVKFNTSDLLNTTGL